ncbi:MAG: glycerophosphodiester phosphodiesterase [Luteibaculaceae bacterium]
MGKVRYTRHAITIPVMLAGMLVTMLGCSKPTLDNPSNLYEGTTFVIGHGGGGFQSGVNPLPHNSFGSIERGIVNLAADGVELDVQLTADGNLILYHDNDLNSMTWCTGPVLSWNSDRVKDCFFVAENLTNLSNAQQVITLDSALIWLSNRRIEPVIFLDFKTHLLSQENNTTELYQAIATKMLELSHKTTFNRPLNLLTNDNRLTLILQNTIPNARFWMRSANFMADTQNTKNLGYYGFIANNQLVEVEQVKFAQDNGLKVCLFNMRSQQGIRSAAVKNPEYLITDNILITKRVLQGI